MRTIKASIIIPAYNTEAYIGDMLECVINQTYKNIEIIIVNDGSTDNTQLIIDEYKQRDERIISLEINNGGVSNARNIGFEKATGDKIFFWDSDDVIELDAVEECIKFAEQEGVNSVLYGYSNRINGVNGLPHKSYLKTIYCGDEIRNQLIPCFIGHSYDDINRWIKGEIRLREYKEHTALWRIMLDTKIIKNNSIRFDTTLSLGEDTKFINEYFLYEYKSGYLDKCLYHLTMRTTGANMTSNANVELMMKNKIKLIEARKELDQKAAIMGMELHKFWQGTMVFSAVQLIIEEAKKTSHTGFIVKLYFENSDVKNAIRMFNPLFGVKSIPFVMLKFGMGRVLFTMLKIIPDSILKK